MVVHRALGHVVLSQNYLPRVIPTKTFYLFLSDIYSDILSDTNSDILSGASCSGLAGNTLILSSGPAGNTATLRLQLGSGGEHSDPELTVRAGGEHSDPELAVRVRQGTLRFCACS